MDTQNLNFQDPIEVQSVNSDVASKTFVAKVFTWMFAGLIITGLAAYLFATDASLASVIYAARPNNGGLTLTPMGWIAAFAPFGLVLLMGMALNRLSFQAMAITFIIFSLLMGMSLSSIFLAYTTTSIYSVFFITAGMFGVMAFLGYTTHTDLTRFGSLLIMLLVGVIIASVVNIFLPHNTGLNYIISFACVAIFTGLTAYDVQKIKKIGAQVGSNGEATVSKMAVFGALSLYLDFINLFIALLRIMGNRRN